MNEAYQISERLRKFGEVRREIEYCINFAFANLRRDKLDLTEKFLKKAEGFYVELLEVFNREEDHPFVEFLEEELKKRIEVEPPTRSVLPIFNILRFLERRRP